MMLGRSIKSLLTIPSSMNQKPDLKSMLMGQGICGVVLLIGVIPTQRKGKGGFSVVMWDRINLKKLTLWRKEEIMAGEQEKDSAVTTKNFASIPL